MKTCSVCHLEKDESCFGKHACRKDGLRGECKACCKAYKDALPARIAVREAHAARMAICAQCKQVPRYVWPSGLKDNYCFPCRQKYNKETHIRRMADPIRREDYLAKSRAYAKTERAKLRARETRTGGGLPPGTLESMLQRQSNKCGLCGDELQPGRLQALDHCHRTGKMRSILCHGCNKGLGAFKDDPVRMAKAISYLAKHG